MSKELPKEILEKHCPSMSPLYLDETGVAFRERILSAMQEYANLRAKPLVDAAKGVLLFCDEDGKPYDGFRLREEIVNLRKALSAYKEGIDNNKNK